MSRIENDYDIKYRVRGKMKTYRAYTKEGKEQFTNELKRLRVPFSVKIRRY